jgi:hypothetical protein
MTELEELLKQPKNTLNIDFNDKFQLERYIKQNDIKMSATDDMYGYLRVLNVLNLIGSSQYLLTERFDGLKQTFSLYDVMFDLQVFRDNEELNKKYKLVNVRFDRGYNIHLRDTDLKYNPTYRSILSYIHRYWLHEKSGGLDYNDIVVQSRKMTEQQFKMLQAKLNMSNALWRIVDYNTIAVVDNKQKKIFVYTMQNMVRK